MGKKSGSGSGIRANNMDHISVSLKINFGVKILKPGWKKIQIRDKHPGSATLKETAKQYLIPRVATSQYQRTGRGIRDHFIYNLPSCRAVRVSGQIQNIHLSVGAEVKLLLVYFWIF
jgi:hypothetical protein